MSPFQRELAALGAREAMVWWVGDRDLATAWRECQRSDWMLWLAEVKQWPGRIVAAYECVRIVVENTSPALRTRLAAALDVGERVPGIWSNYAEASAIDAVNAVALGATCDVIADAAHTAGVDEALLADTVRRLVIHEALSALTTDR